jgi:hypothetical protein
MLRSEKARRSLHVRFAAVGDVYRIHRVYQKEVMDVARQDHEMAIAKHFWRKVHFLLTLGSQSYHDDNRGRECDFKQ